MFCNSAVETIRLFITPWISSMIHGLINVMTVWLCEERDTSTNPQPFFLRFTPAVWQLWRSPPQTGLTERRSFWVRTGPICKTSFQEIYRRKASGKSTEATWRERRERGETAGMLQLCVTGVRKSGCYQGGSKTRADLICQSQLRVLKGARSPWKCLHFYVVYSMCEKCLDFEQSAGNFLKL